MIGVDATATGTGTSSAGPITWTHTCAGSQRVLWVGIVISDNTTIPTTGSVTGVTYNGVAMTLAPNTAVADGTAYATWLYYLINPASGANTVSVALSTTYSAIRTGSLSLTNANQATQPDASNSFTATIQNPSNSLTTIMDNSMLVDIVGIDGVATLTGPNVTGQISVFNLAIGTKAAGMSYRPAGTPGPQSMGWSDSASVKYIQSIASTSPNRPSVQTNNLRPHAFSPGLAR